MEHLASKKFKGRKIRVDQADPSPGRSGGGRDRDFGGNKPARAGAPRYGGEGRGWGGNESRGGGGGYKGRKKFA
jgi:hypothetical protein